MPDRRDRPRLAWFSPVRPVASGIAHYSEDLLPVLASAWDLDVYVAGEHPSQLVETAHLRVRPARAFCGQQRRAPYDAVVYQMGNSPAHGYLVEAALAVPGIVVLHDTVLHHLRLGMFLVRHDARGYRRVMEERYGQAGRVIAAHVLAGQIPEALFDFPLTEDVVEAAKLVVVHNDFSRARVLAHHQNAPVMRVAHAMPLPPYLAHAEARQSLGLRPDEFILGSVTHVNRAKRFPTVLRALRWLREEVPARLVVAGTSSDAVSIERLARMFGVESAVDVLGYVDDRVARQVYAAADVCVNLRYPTAGETSGSLLRAMAAGRPVLVSDAGAFSEYPDDTVVKVPHNALEEEMATELLRSLAARSELRAAIGRNARAWIAREHSMAVTVRGYRDAVSAAAGWPLPLPSVPGDENDEDAAVADTADGAVPDGLRR